MATKNLVGSARILSDIVAEFHRVIGEWKELYLTGLDLVPELEATRGDVEARGELCEKMGDIVRDMVLVHTRMCYLRDQIESLEKLNAHSPPPFKTWRYMQFLDVITKIVEIFKKEIVIRHVFVKGCTSATGEELNFFTIGWVHLIYANDSCDMNFQAVLNEIGLSTS